jgi:hypothetical protein
MGAMASTTGIITDTVSAAGKQREGPSIKPAARRLGFSLCRCRYSPGFTPAF